MYGDDVYWELRLRAREVQLKEKGLCFICETKPAKVENYCWTCWGYVE